jgi:hypothetical protein
MMVGILGIEGVLPSGYSKHHIDKFNGRLEVLLLFYVKLLCLHVFHVLLIIVENPCNLL